METTNSAEKTAKSLERKTEKELIEIILRKDAVERSLRADIKGTERTLEETQGHLDIVNEKLYEAKKVVEANHMEFEAVCDELASVRQEYKDLVTKNKLFYTILIVGLIIAMIF